MQLWSDFLTNEKRVIHKWTHYLPVYERHLARFQGQSVAMLEIGCGAGGRPDDRAHSCAAPPGR